MISVFVKEQRAYTRAELNDIFKKDEANTCIKKLKEYGILKTIKLVDRYTDLSDLNDLEIIVDEDDSEIDHMYVFNFVGIIIINGFILKCYPKYIFKTDEPIEELKQIIKVLEKYNSSEQIIKMYVNNQNDNEFNRLAAMIYLFNDYYENGVYNNQMDILETNGNGDINWNRTINETFALLHNDRPYYIELQTVKHKCDDFDFIKRLHECVLTLCSKELRESSLLDIFGLSEIDLTDESIDDLGDKEYILLQIEKEMNIQFNTRKLSLLQALYMFISNDGTIVENSTLSLYGTNSFHNVWEKICADVMGNKLDCKLKHLKMPKPLDKSFNGDNKLIDIIEKPLWIDIEANEHKAAKSLIPDLISFCSNQFVIFDAKYYNITLEPNKRLQGNPGVEDVTKEYLYQLAYKDFIEKQGFVSVKNCFLMPTEQNEIIVLGSVKMKILENIGLEDIKIRQLPAREMYNLYLTNQNLNIDRLKL